MGTTADKLQAVLNSKNAIKTKFNLPDDLPFSQYAENIKATGGDDPTADLGISDVNGNFMKVKSNGEFLVPDGTVTTIENLYTFQATYIIDPFTVENITDQPITIIVSSFFATHYKINNNNWHSMPMNTGNIYNSAIVLEKRGDKMSLFNNNDNGGNRLDDNGDLYLNGPGISCDVPNSFKVYGDIMSLRNYSECTPGCFGNLFHHYDGRNGLVDASGLKLPTKLAPHCFYGMFWYCKNLTAAPALPATELAEACYKYMFLKCENLTVAPALPATELAPSCYSMMFRETNLAEAPELPATKMAEKCYEYMFAFCENLTVAPALPATELAEKCYMQIFWYCKNLTEAPALPATKLAEACYFSMFEHCYSLVEFPELPATELAKACYQYMFRDANVDTVHIKVHFTKWPTEKNALRNWLHIGKNSGEGIFEKPASLPTIFDDVKSYENEVDCPYDRIPDGWTVIDFDK